MFKSEFSKRLRDTSLLLCMLLGFAIQVPIAIACAYFFMLALGFFHSGGCSLRELGVAAACVFLLLLSVVQFNHGVAPLFYLFFLPFVFFISKAFSMNRLEYLESVVFFVFWVFAILIITAGLVNIDQPEPLGAVFPWSSTNGLPSYLIVIQVLYSLLFYLCHGRLPILSSIATLSVAILGLGRGSILVALLILLLALIVEIQRGLAHRPIWKLLTALMVSMLLCYGVLLSPLNDFEMRNFLDGTKFAGGVLDEHRGRIVVDYLNKIDLWGLIFGTSYEGTSIERLYGGNPHNSYIRLHSFYGLVGLVFFVIPFFLLVSSRTVFRQKMVAFVLICLLAVRAVTEPIFFPTALDFFYFLSFFVFFRFSTKRSG